MANELTALGKDELSTENTTQYIVVSLGNEQYGIDIKYIDNIVRMQSITRVPKSAEYFRGVINLRGEVVPVMSLRIKMGLDTDEITGKSRIIILKLEASGSIGVLVDEVKKVVTIGDSQIEHKARDSKSGVPTYINGVGKVEGGLISLLDLSTIIDEPQQ